MAKIQLVWPYFPIFTQGGISSQRINATSGSLSVVMYAEEAFTATSVLYTLALQSGMNKSDVSATVTSGNSSIAGTNSWSANDVVTWRTSAPTGFTVGTPYYVRATGLTSSAFSLSASSGGSAITPTSGGSFTVASAWPGTLRVGLQSVNTSDGLCSGTWLGGGNGYVDKSTWTNTDVGNTLVATLGSSVSINRGDVFAIVAQAQSGTWSTSEWCDIGYYVAGIENPSTPYVLIDNAKSLSGTRACSLAVRSSSRAYGFPWQSQSSYALNSSAIAEIGLKFSLPSSVCTTFSVAGIKFHCDTSSGFSITMSLYQGTDRTPLQSITIDTDQTGTNTTAGYCWFYFDETTLSTLSPNTEYRVMIATSNSSNVLSFRMADVLTESDSIPYRGEGSTACYTRYASGSYTDTTTLMPPIQLVISDMTASASGGLLVHPGMAGGMRG